MVLQLERDTLIIGLMPLARRVAWRTRRRYARPLDMEDAIQIAYLSLIWAVDHYEGRWPLAQIISMRVRWDLMSAHRARPRGELSLDSLLADIEERGGLLPAPFRVAGHAEFDPDLEELVAAATAGKQDVSIAEVFAVLAPGYPLTRTAATRLGAVLTAQGWHHYKCSHNCGYRYSRLPRAWRSPQIYAAG